VALSEGLTGRIYELKVDQTTVGRVDDNTIQIAEPSVSSHHCEIILQGAECVVKDLNSTNGTFVNGQKVTTQSPIKPGQVLRLGQIDLRYETGDTPASAPAAPSAPPPPKKLPEQTLAVPRGVQFNELAQEAKAVSFDKNSAFSKKSNKGTIMFIGIAVAVGVIVIAFIVYILLQQVSN
jgi:pSer/pThr/pTyr-binding forkhead associated (FHA) protein